MVIKCPRCSSRYKIDAAGLPEEGTYARCRNCENVFFVRKRSREEVSALRKSKKAVGLATPATAVEAPPPHGHVSAIASDNLGEDGGFSPPPEIKTAQEKQSQEASFEGRVETTKPETDNNDIEALLTAYAPEPPEDDYAPGFTPASTSGEVAVGNRPPEMGQEPTAPKPEDTEEPSLSLLPDDIDALLAAHSPVKKTKADESVSMPLQDDIEALLAANAPAPSAPVAKKQESSSVSQDDIAALLAANAPAPSAPVAKKQESASVSQDDIEALLAANAPAPSAPVAKKQESASVSQDDIAALLAANAPAPSAPVAKKQESSSVSQDDIEALLAANAPAPSAPVAKKQESASVSQDDIEALLAANAPAPSAPVAKKQESASVSQDDIEALLAANAPAPSAPVAKKQESSSVSQDDIEALLAANAPAPSAPVAKRQESASVSQDDIEALLAANAPASSAPVAKKQESASISQDDIAALLAANAPGKGEAPATVSTNSIQDDIDSLLAANSPFTQSTKQAAGGGQSEIDQLLASAMGKSASKPAAVQPPTPPKAGDELLSQSDLDALLSQAPQPAGTAKSPEPTEGEGLISQLDIDSILDSAGFDEPGQAPLKEPETPKDDGLLSQDTLESLLSEASESDAEKPAMAPAMGVSEDDELQKLLAGEEDSLGEALFENSSKATVSTGEPSLDEMLAGELTPREPVPAGGQGDEDFAGAMPGVFARGEASFPSVEEEVEEGHAKKKGFSLAALFAPAVAALKKVFEKIPLPKFKFIGAIFHKLPPRIAGVAAGLALAVVAGSAVGGWWFLTKGGQAKETIHVAEKGADQAHAPKPETAPTAQPTAAQEGHPAQPAPAPAKAPDEAKVAVHATAGQAPAASPKGARGKYPVSFVVYLPVEFDTEATKVLNMNVELIFESETVAKLVRERLFFSAVTVEKVIDDFFRDKFFEETVFAQDKLEEFLAQNLKAVKQFAGLKDVRLSGFSID